MGALLYTNDVQILTPQVSAQQVSFLKRPEASAVRASQTTQNLWLDVIRFSAFCRVFSLHTVASLAALYGTTFLLNLAEQLRHGVTCFFVLSGFLMTKKMIRPDFRSTQFFGHRMMRIAPPYWFFLACMVFLFGRLSGSHVRAFSQSLADFTFMSDYVQGLHMHTWAVAVEVKFYLLISVIGWIMSRIGERRNSLLWISITILYVIGLMSRLISGAGTDGAPTATMFHERLDDFAIGMAIAGISRKRMMPKSAVLLASSGLVMMIAILSPFHWGRQSLLAIAFALLVLGASRARSISPGFLSYLSSLTYNAYLWHFTIGAFCILLFAHTPAEASPLRLAIGIALGFLMSLLMAMALQKWVDTTIQSWSIRVRNLLIR